MGSIVSSGKSLREFPNHSTPRGSVVRLCHGITVKILVWLAAILVPVQALPGTGCDCGSRSPQSTAVKPDRADAAPAAKCPHCTSGRAPARSCCGVKAASPARQGSCCGAKESSRGCCQGGRGSPGTPCLCSGSQSAPASVPVSSHSRTDNTKTPLGCSPDAVTTVIVAPPAVLAHAAQRPSLVGSTSLERLTTLCRLVL